MIRSKPSHDPERVDDREREIGQEHVLVRPRTQAGLAHHGLEQQVGGGNADDELARSPTPSQLHRRRHLQREIRDRGVYGRETDDVDQRPRWRCAPTTPSVLSMMVPTFSCRGGATCHVVSPPSIPALPSDDRRVSQEARAQAKTSLISRSSVVDATVDRRTSEGSDSAGRGPDEGRHHFGKSGCLRDRRWRRPGPHARASRRKG